MAEPLYNVDTAVSKVFTNPDTGKPKLYYGKVTEVGSNGMYTVLYNDGDKETIKEEEIIDIIDEGGSGKMPAAKRRKVSSSRRQGNYTSIYQKVPNNNKKTTLSPVAVARKTIISIRRE